VEKNRRTISSNSNESRCIQSPVETLVSNNCSTNTSLFNSLISSSTFDLRQGLVCACVQGVPVIWMKDWLNFRKSFVTRFKGAWNWSCAFLSIRKSDSFTYTQLFFLSAILPPQSNDIRMELSYVFHWLLPSRRSWTLRRVHPLSLFIHAFANRRNLTPSYRRALINITHPSRNWAWCLSWMPRWAWSHPSTPPRTYGHNVAKSLLPRRSGPLHRWNLPHSHH